MNCSYQTPANRLTSALVMVVLLTKYTTRAIISIRQKGGDSMAYKITDACIMCGACADTCPVDAIREGDDRYVIDAQLCINCGTCADTCPVEAIEEE